MIMRQSPASNDLHYATSFGLQITKYYIQLLQRITKFCFLKNEVR